MSDDRDSLGQELTRRVVYALLGPAIRVAFVFRVPIKEVVDLLQMAYYHETRRHGLLMREVSELLDVSMRKVALLSKRLKQNFADEESAHELPRRIEFMLWAGPLSAARLKQALPDVDADELDEALAVLLEQGRVELQEGRTVAYRVVRNEFRLVRDELLARLDGLNNLLSAVSNAVFARFFRADDRAFARTLSFRVRGGDMDRLRQLYEEQIWTTLRDLDAAAQNADDAEEIGMSITWAPYDYINRTLDRDEGGSES